MSPVNRPSKAYEMDQKLLKIASIAAVLGLCAMIGVQQFRSNGEASDVNDGGSNSGVAKVADPDAEAKRAALRETVLGNYGKPLAALPEDASSKNLETGVSKKRSDAEISLRTGVIGATPSRSDITVIQKFPYAHHAVRLAYANARDRACRLLVPGAPVSPPLSRPRVGQASSLGRMTVMTLGLEFDVTGPKKLPAITRGQVEKYFREHRLAVQPILYCDKNNRPYFGTDCEAAFYEIQRPGTTLKPEPMIGVAIARFRALGIVGTVDGKEGPDDVLGRTLALAFTFAKKDDTITGASDKAQLVTEVMLLHLTPDCLGDEPEVQVFVTSDERTNLHRLETSGMRLNSPTPLISSDIQFNKTVLMGMYPAAPVVSGIRYRSSGILSMETVKRLGTADGDRPAVSLTEILDQFGKLVGFGK